MKILDVIQGSKEWFDARAGIPTASNFKKIYSGGGKKSESASKYMDLLIAEYLAGKPLGNNVETKATRRGNALEPEARLAYEYITGNDVKQVGFCLDDSGLYGCSPDGLIGTEGGLEIKCEGSDVIAGYYRRGFPIGHKSQVQGSLLVTGYKWWDFMAYHPDLRPLILRIERDEPYINALFSEINAFSIKLREEKQLLEKWKK